MSGTNESKDRPPWEGGRNGAARGRGKGGKPHNKGADNAAGRGEGRAQGTDQKRIDPQDLTSPYLFMVRGKTSKLISSSLRNNSQLSLVSNSVMLSTACGLEKPLKKSTMPRLPMRSWMKTPVV